MLSQILGSWGRLVFLCVEEEEVVTPADVEEMSQTKLKQHKTSIFPIFFLSDRRWVNRAAPLPHCDAHSVKK